LACFPGFFIVLRLKFSALALIAHFSLSTGGLDFKLLLAIIKSNPY